MASLPPSTSRPSSDSENKEEILCLEAYSDSDISKKDDNVVCVPATESLDNFPDGGVRAWIVLFGTFCISFSSWGYINSWGVFQAYYQQTLLHESSPSEIAWIGSAQHCLIFMPGLIVGRMFDIGMFRIPCAIGSFTIVLATMLVPLCRVYWHFLLCQGLAIGIGCAFVFPTTTAVTSHWWNRRRGFALGVMTCGAALGGTCFPILIRQLLDVVGFGWTMRIIGFILIFMLTIANLCIARRLPPTKAAGGLFGWHVFRNAAFSVYCASNFMVSLGAFTILTYISSSAASVGISRNISLYFVAIINASSGVGRVACGLLGDRLGAMNVIIPMTAAVAAINIVWPHCRTETSYIVISVLYGFMSGAYSALGPVPVAAMGGIEDLGRRIGIMNTVVGLGALCGPPLAGLLDGTSLGYTAVGYFAGGNLLVGVVFITIARFLAVPSVWSKY
ncbi:MFS general substrate transporter [Mycena epipterygia]|nr:MFS general substrate transporter [Mycena epipterygia]